MDDTNIHLNNEDVFRIGKFCVYSYAEGQEFIEKEILKYQRKKEIVKYLKKKKKRPIG